MKKKLNLNTKKMQDIINKTPSFVVILLMIVIAPIGVWFFVEKTKKNKKRIYNKSKNLIWMGVFIIFLLAVGIFSKVKEIIELCSSGMSLDMIDLVPDNIWLYIMGIVMSISYLIGAKKVNEQSKIERKYIKIINVDKETSLKKISKELLVTVEEVTNSIKTLQKCGYLVPLETDEKKNKIVYLDSKEQKIVTRRTEKNIKARNTIQCPKCGAIVLLKLEEYVECDFCGHGLIEENNL